jgi:hypothetical protein
MCFIMGEDDISLECLDWGRVDRTRLRLLEDIMDCWQKFKTDFYRVGKNRDEMLLFGNRMLDGMQETIEVRIFGRARYAAMRERLQGVRYKDVCSEDGTLLDMNRINRKFRVNINWAEYFRLRAELERINEGLGERIDDEDGTTLDEVAQSKAKGCKKFRMAMVGRRSFSISSMTQG